MTRNKQLLYSLWTLIASSALILAGAPSSLAQEELEVLASGDADKDEYGDSTVDVNQIEQAEDGRYTNLVLTFNNEYDDAFSPNDINSEEYSYDQTSLSGIRLYDEASKTYYYPLTDNRPSPRLEDADTCLCSNVDVSTSFLTEVAADSSGSYWASYLLPKDLKKVSVHVPGFEPVEVDIE